MSHPKYLSKLKWKKDYYTKIEMESISNIANLSIVRS